jgi:hypothetical protein
MLLRSINMALPLLYNSPMVKFLQHRRGYSLIVCIAILLNLLAPAIGHAMAQLSRDPLALEICSVGAAPTRQAPGEPANQPANHAIKHCVLCAIHADNAAPPPAIRALVAVLAGHDRHPPLHDQSPSPPHIWPAAAPRGPPALS